MKRRALFFLCDFVLCALFVLFAIGLEKECQLGCFQQKKSKRKYIKPFPWETTPEFVLD
jgi:hypothetical protein